MAGGTPIQLFTHAPISEFINLLAGVKLDLKVAGIFSLPGDDIGWPWWWVLTQTKVLKEVTRARDKWTELEPVEEEWVVDGTMGGKVVIKWFPRVP